MTCPTMPGPAWSLAFEDTFDGPTVDRARWASRHTWRMNNVTCDDALVTIANGKLALGLSPTAGSAVQSTYGVPVGGVAEARISFPGDGRQLYNFAAFWLFDWGGAGRAAGENDIAEVLSGLMTVNYHSDDLNQNHGPVDGYWGDDFHIYTLHRLADHCDVYYDGVKVRSYPTTDDGRPQPVVLNVGTGRQGGPTVYGAPSRVLVDYVRCWEPAAT